MILVNVFIAICATAALLCIGIGQILVLLEKIGRRLESIERMLKEPK